MQNIVSILKVVLPLIVSLGIGFYARKRAVLTPEAIEGMKTFVMKFALPAMLFGLFFTAEYSVSILLFAATMFTFSSIEIESGAVLHIASMFRVASPQTKNEENAPFSRMCENISANGLCRNSLK